MLECVVDWFSLYSRSKVKFCKHNALRMKLLLKQRFRKLRNRFFSRIKYITVCKIC